MQVLGVEEPLMCKAFLPTLKGLAQKWFLALPSRSIRCFNDLADRFLTHYAVNIKPQRNLTHLSGISQDEGEALKTYLTRWQKEVQTIEGLDEQVAITFFMESLRAGKLFIDLHNDRPKTYVEAMQRASRQADTEEANERILLPSIEPKIIPEDVCVAEELDPEEHPEVFWMEEIRKYKEKGDLPDNPTEAAKLLGRSSPLMGLEPTATAISCHRKSLDVEENSVLCSAAAEKHREPSCHAKLLLRRRRRRNAAAGVHHGRWKTGDDGGRSCYVLAGCSSLPPAICFVDVVAARRRRRITELTRCAAVASRRGKSPPL
nr:uncharacterized protein LOC109150821 [Ipomoea batatas]